MISSDRAQDENHPSLGGGSIHHDKDNDIMKRQQLSAASPLADDHRYPLSSLDMNIDHSHSSHHKGGSATPLSLKSRGSVIDKYYGTSNDAVKLRYVLSPHDDNEEGEGDDDSSERFHNDKSAIVVEDYKCTNTSIHSPSSLLHNTSHDLNSMTGNSIGMSLCKNAVDYDSVLYSGYAGSISAAPSELSYGYSVEDGKENSEKGTNLHVVWSKALQTKKAKESRRSKRRAGGESMHSDDESASNKGDFSVQLKRMREQRRKKKMDSMKEHRASILTEFRAFLSRNGTRDARNRCEDENDMPGDNGSIGTTLKTPTMKRARDRSGSNDDFTPTHIHGRIPWIVFERDLEEDVSTIHGGSRCEGFTGSPKSEIGLEQSSDLVMNKRVENATGQENGNDVEQQKEGGRNIMSCIDTKNRDRMDLVYTLLIILSIATLVAVVVIIIVQV